MFKLPLKQSNRWAISLSLCIIASGMAVSAAMPDNEPGWVALVDDVATSDETISSPKIDPDESNPAFASTFNESLNVEWNTTFISTDKVVRKEGLFAIVNGRVCVFSKRREASTCACKGSGLPFEYKIETLQATPVGSANKTGNAEQFAVYGSKLLNAARKEQKRHLISCAKPCSPEEAADNEECGDLQGFEGDQVRLASYNPSNNDSVDTRANDDEQEGDTEISPNKMAGAGTVLEDHVNVLSVYGDKFGIETSRCEKRSLTSPANYLRQWKTVSLSENGSSDVRLGTWWHRASMDVENQFFSQPEENRDGFSPDGWRSFVIRPSQAGASADFGLNHQLEMRVLQSDLEDGTSSVSPYLYAKPSRTTLVMPKELELLLSKKELSFSSPSPDGKMIVFASRGRLYTFKKSGIGGSGKIACIGSVGNVRGIQWIAKDKLNRSDSKALQL